MLGHKFERINKSIEETKVELAAYPPSIADLSSLLNDLFVNIAQIIK